MKTTHQAAQAPVARLSRWGTPVRRWTEAEVEFVRAHFRTHTHAEIASALGRTAKSVASYCKVHGLIGRHGWTEAELAAVREGVAEGLTAAQIGARIGRTVLSVYQQRAKLNMARKLDLHGLDELIRDKHALGWSDGEIADEWNRARPDEASRLARETISSHRRKLKLPSNRDSDHLRDRVRQKTEAQLRETGVASLAELKREVIRARIEAMGWPGDLRWGEAQILSLIWERGPMTKREIADAIGDGRGAKALLSNGKGGSHLATLMRRGLLISFKRAVRTGRKGGNVDLYSLNPLTIQRRAHAGAQQPEGREETRETDGVDRQPRGRAVDGAAPVAAGAA